MNFARCEAYYDSSTQAQRLYNYTGHVYGGRLTDGKYITAAGCSSLCGSGVQLYRWRDMAATITTWVLPMMGMLLTAPFVSNAFRKTMQATCRWVGSPIVSLAHVLWNINFLGRCCLVLDLATGFDEFPAEGSEFHKLRDSFYILTVLNQYTVSVQGPSVERLIRVALFSNVRGPGDNEPLWQKRGALAQSLRSRRRRGVVPALISLIWFLFCLAVSIEAAFNQLGENAVAHDLALGLLLTWVPILMLMTIIDRNPSDDDNPLWKLNEIIDDARSCLADQNYRQQLCDSCGADPNEFDNLSYTPSQHDKGLFKNFAGQGRKRWFFGVAHNIIAGIEDNLVAEYGRGWLNDELQARACLLRPFKVHSLSWVSWRALWQVIVAIIIVCGTVGSAFIISYFTPTVGMGCRTGSYMIVSIFALFLLLVEMGSWRWTHTHPRGKVWLGRGLLVIEVTNAFWLVWIALAQVTGAYRTCACESSTWGYGGGYINLLTTRHNPAPQTAIYWSAGTTTTCFILFCSIFFIVQQWCEQSHISTLDYKKATQGLRVCRAFRKWTHWLRSGPEQLLHLVHLLGTKIFGGSLRRVRAVWMHRPRQRARHLPERPKTPHGSVSQEKGARVSVIEGSQVDLAPTVV